MSDAEEFKARVQFNHKRKIAESVPARLRKSRVDKCELRRKREDIEERIKLKKELEL